MISFEYLPNEGGLTGLMTVTAPLTPSQTHAHTQGSQFCCPAWQEGWKFGKTGSWWKPQFLCLLIHARREGKRNKNMPKWWKQKAPSGSEEIWAHPNSTRTDTHMQPRTDTHIQASSGGLRATFQPWPAFDPTFLSIPEGSNHPTHKHCSNACSTDSPKNGETSTKERAGKRRVWKVNSNSKWIENQAWSEEHTEQLEIWSGWGCLSLTAKQSQGSSDIKPNPGVTAQYRVLLQRTLGYKSYCNYVVFLF